MKKKVHWSSKLCPNKSRHTCNMTTKLFWKHWGISGITFIICTFFWESYCRFFCSSSSLVSLILTQDIDGLSTGSSWKGSGHSWKCQDGTCLKIKWGKGNGVRVGASGVICLPLSLLPSLFYSLFSLFLFALPLSREPVKRIGHWLEYKEYKTTVYYYWLFYWVWIFRSCFFFILLILAVFFICKTKMWILDMLWKHL